MYRAPLVCAPSDADLWFGAMNRSWIPIGAALLAAMAAGLWLWTARTPRAAPPAAEPAVAAPAGSGSLEGRLAALEKELAAERDARLGLESEVEMLRLLLEESAGVPPKPPPGAAAAEAAPPAASEETAGGAPSLGEDLWFDAPALAKANVPSHEVDRLRRLFEESELEVLQLRDRATRDGWAETPRFLQELYETRAGLRAEVGDETFDWLLYATQRPNRVVARSLLSNGAAAQAGLQAGDIILRYDGRTIFKGGELQNATRQGKAGRPVVMEVMTKGGEVHRVTVPSGPLGIQLSQVVVAPQSVR
jgi:PDZ domain-containing protein